jgi:hypothetical protein
VRFVLLHVASAHPFAVELIAGSTALNHHLAHPAFADWEVSHDYFPSPVSGLSRRA